MTLAADMSCDGQGGDPHRKASALTRQSLGNDTACPYAVGHGDGLTSPQDREAGAVTREDSVERGGSAAVADRKRRMYVSMSVAPAGEALRPAGGSFRLALKEPFYVGIGVCAHNDDALETAVFANVELIDGTPPASAKPSLISTIETITLSSKDRRVVWWTPNLIEAPNWLPDGTHLLFNGKGRIHRIAAAGGEPVLIDSGFATRCNNDHGISPDGTQLVISDQSQGDKRSRIYTLPITGGTPNLVTDTGPSYWHGWSPDGRTLAYCAERNGEFDICMIRRWRNRDAPYRCEGTGR